MFWKKKSAFQEIAERLDKHVEMHISNSTQKSAEALKNGIVMIAQSAGSVNYRRAEKLSKNGATHFSDMIRGAYLIGYDYKKRYKSDLKVLEKLNDFPPEVDEHITEITQPLVDTVVELVEISHSPGRLVLFEENKDEVKKGLVGGIFTVAAEYFFEGVKQAEIS